MLSSTSKKLPMSIWLLFLLMFTLLPTLTAWVLYQHHSEVIKKVHINENNNDSLRRSIAKINHSIMQARQQELAFHGSYNPKFSALFFVEINEILKGINRVTDILGDDAIQTQANKDTWTYKQNFEKYIEQVTLLGLSPDSERRGSMRKLHQHFSKLIQNIQYTKSQNLKVQVNILKQYEQEILLDHGEIDRDDMNEMLEDLMLAIINSDLQQQERLSADTEQYFNQLSRVARQLREKKRYLEALPQKYNALTPMLTRLSQLQDEIYFEGLAYKQNMLDQSEDNFKQGLIVSAIITMVLVLLTVMGIRNKRAH